MPTPPTTAATYHRAPAQPPSAPPPTPLQGPPPLKLQMHPITRSNFLSHFYLFTEG